MHGIPTYGSWPNQVERFFSLITEKAMRCGSFASGKQLVQRIVHFVAPGGPMLSRRPAFVDLHQGSRNFGHADGTLDRGTPPT